jgi:hypothetical protein
MDGIARGLKASQWMKIKARDIHFLGPRYNVQTVKAAQDAWMEFGADLSCSSALPKLGQTLASAALSTPPSVSC